MKRKILVGALSLSLFFGGVASAGTVNGLFEGKSIVKVLFGGKEVIATDVPAYSDGGRTMVPLYMLRNMGATVAWDQKTASVNVGLPEIVKNDLDQIMRDVKQYNVGYVSGLTLYDGQNSINYLYMGNLETMADQVFDKIISTALNTEYRKVVIIDDAGTEFSVPTQSVRDFKNGLINQEQLSAVYKYTFKPVTNPQNQQQPTYNTPDTTSQNNANYCKYLKDEYILAKGRLANDVSPFSGQYEFALQRLESEWSLKLSAIPGCTK